MPHGRSSRRLVAVPDVSAAAVVSGDVEAIEQAIDRYDAQLEPLETFILPAGSRAAAALHVARAVCRRAERRLVLWPARSRPPLVRHFGLRQSAKRFALCFSPGRPMPKPALPTGRAEA